MSSFYSDEDVTWFGSHVAWGLACVESMLGEDEFSRVEQRDGVWIAYPDEAHIEIHIRQEPDLMLEVRCRAARELVRSAKLLRQLNELNERNPMDQVFMAAKDLVVRRSIAASAVSPGVLIDAIVGAREHAANIGVLFAAMFDGEALVHPDVEPAYEDGDWFED